MDRQIFHLPREVHNLTKQIAWSRLKHFAETDLCELMVSYKFYNALKISIPSPHRRDWNFLRGGGFSKAKTMKEMYQAGLEFPVGWGSGKKPFRGGGIDIFWNYSLYSMGSAET